VNVALLMPLARQRGGAEQLLRALLRCGRSAKGVSWQVAFLEDGPLRAEFDALGVPTTVVAAGRLRQGGRYAATVARLARLFRRERIDVALSWMVKAHLYAGPAAWLAEVPALWYQHGIPQSAGWMDRLATLIPARGVVACSEAAARVQRRRWPVRPVRTVHPCVELDRFDPERLPPPAEARRRLGLPEAGPLVGIVGRMQRWKGIHVFVEAMARVRRAHPDVHGVVVGGRHELEADYADAIEAQVAQRGLERGVTLAGFQGNVPLWVQAMDVVVHASDREPFGMVIPEAMALGKPVVAGASGGPREIITEGKDGLLAPYGDAGTLARAVSGLLRAPARADALGQAARRRAQAFSPPRFAERLTAAIRGLAS